MLSPSRRSGLTRSAIGLAVVMSAVPFLHVAVPNALTAHDFARLVQLAVLLVGALAWGLWSPSAGKSFLAARPMVRGGLAALGILVIASCLHAVHPVVAAREVVLLGSVLLLAVPLATALSDPRTRDRFLDVLAVGAAAHGVLWMLLLVSAAMSAQTFTPWELVFGFDNPRFLNHAQTMALPLIGVVLVRPNTPAWIRIAAAVALFSAGALLSMYVARATLLGLLVGGLVAIFVMGRHVWRCAAATSAAFGVGALAMGVAWTIWLRHLTAPMIDDLLHTHRRNVLWDQVAELFMSSPWLGVGPMHFAQTVNPVAAHPHNAYLQLLVEYGLPAAVLVAILVVVFLRRVFTDLRREASNSPALVAALIVSTVAMLVDSAFSGNWVMPVSQLWIAVLLALLLSLNPRVAEAQPIPRPRGFAMVGRALVLAAMVAATAQALVESFDAQPHVQTGEAMKMSIGRAAQTPRFWSHGWF